MHAVEDEDSPLHLWHPKFGHLNFQGLQNMERRQLGVSLPKLRGKEGVCSTCLIGKQHRSTFPKQSQWQALERLYPTTINQDLTPQERWSGTCPSVEHFKVFGCTAYVHVLDQQWKKLDNKSIKCFFLWISSESKPYRLYNPARRKVVFSRDVVFDERHDWEHADSSSEKGKTVVGDASKEIDTKDIGAGVDSAPAAGDMAGEDPSVSEASSTPEESTTFEESTEQ
ncbi:LOW QUALITY PROTEIN: hypothetical protein V2J09_010632 [Rumex salicifolius]